jgi:hypothetical protein
MVTVIKKKDLQKMKKPLKIKHAKGVKHNWGGFFGKVKFEIDGVKYQRDLR